MTAAAATLWAGKARLPTSEGTRNCIGAAISQVLRTDGYIAKLQARGYDVEAP
jgi:hypothetical protein